jgi:hypothetical protein
VGQAEVSNCIELCLYHIDARSSISRMLNLAAPDTRRFSMAGSEAIYPVLADWPCQTWTSLGKLKAALADFIRHFHHQSRRSRESRAGQSRDPSYKCLLFGVRENLLRFVRLRGRSSSSEPVTQGSRKHIVCLRYSLFR